MQKITSVVSLSLLFLTLAAKAMPAADSRLAIKRIHQVNRQFGKMDVTYPVFTAGSVPGYLAINAALKRMVKRARCDRAESGRSAKDYEMSTDISVGEITTHFVSLKVASSNYCGGAYPNVSATGLVYSAKNGEPLDVQGELGYPKKNSDLWTDADYAQLENFQNKMADFLSTRMTKEATDCFADADKETGTPFEVKDDLKMLEYNFGLADHAVVFYGEPAHVIYACAFELTIPYSEVKALLEPQSVLHAWLGH